MKISNLIAIVCLTIFSISPAISQDQMSKEKFPYYEIPTAPKNYTACSVTARMIDGLGFRYFWATESLTAEDLEYKTSESGRSSFETMKHIYGLSNVIVNVVNKRVNKTTPDKDWTFEEMRLATLNNFMNASTVLKNSKDKELKEMEVIFQRIESESRYPFWNAINGPIEDAIWHVGQVVMMRRASGNPINGKASVFSGKLRS